MCVICVGCTQEDALPSQKELDAMPEGDASMAMHEAGYDTEQIAAYLDMRRANKAPSCP